MAKSCCVLCAQPVSWLDRLFLPVCETEQAVCSDCHQRFQSAPPGEQERLRQQILKSPHLTDRETIEAYQKAVYGKSCSACGGAMERKVKNFLIGSDGYSGLSSLGMQQYMVDLYSCTRCGKVELYTANFKSKENV